MIDERGAARHHEPERERQASRFPRLVMLRLRLATKSPFLTSAKPRLQRIQSNRFGHVRVESAITRPLPIDVLAIPGNGDDLQPLRLR